MTDAVRELFDLLVRKDQSGSDYTGTVTSIEGKVAHVQFDGATITDTPVALSIGAKKGDAVRVRVADGRAWLIGNDTAPPNDSSEVASGLKVTNDNLSATSTQLRSLAAEYGVFNTVVTQKLTAHQAVIDELDATYANITLANIDTANINTAKVKDLFTEVGLIRDAVISGAKITGYLDAVKINAASIDAGTLSVDRLVIRGTTESLVYAINNISGALQSQSVDTINGEVLTDRTILADKIVTHSITANEITAENIVGLGGWINLAQGTFNYGADKLVWDGSVLSVDGVINTTSGSIGGWTITSNSLKSDGNTINPNAASLLLKSGDDGEISVSNRTYGESRIKYDGIHTYNSDSEHTVIRGSTVTVYTSGSTVPGTKYKATLRHNGLTFTDTTNSVTKITLDATTGAGTFSATTKVANNYPIFQLEHSSGPQARFMVSSTGIWQGLWSNGYYDGTTLTSDGKWFLFRDNNNHVRSECYMYPKNTDGTERIPIGTSPTAGSKIAAIYASSATRLNIISEWSVSGTYTANHIETTASDPKLKHDIKPSSLNALDLIKRIPLSEFVWNDTNIRWDVGFIAPELYAIDANLAIKPEDDTNAYWGVNSFYITGVLVKAVQELTAQVAELKRRVA